MRMDILNAIGLITVQVVIMKGSSKGKIKHKNIRFEVFTFVKIHIVGLWDMILSLSPVGGHRYLGRTY
jgi:hypothetical protein